MALPIFIIASVLAVVWVIMMMQLKTIKRIHPNTKLLVDALERLAMHPYWPQEHPK